MPINLTVNKNTPIQNGFAASAAKKKEEQSSLKKPVLAALAAASLVGTLLAAYRSGFFASQLPPIPSEPFPPKVIVDMTGQMTTVDFLKFYSDVYHGRLGPPLSLEILGFVNRTSGMSASAVADLLFPGLSQESSVKASRDSNHNIVSPPPPPSKQIFREKLQAFLEKESGMPLSELEKLLEDALQRHTGSNKKPAPLFNITKQCPVPTAYYTLDQAPKDLETWDTVPINQYIGKIFKDYPSFNLCRGNGCPKGVAQL